MQPWVMHYYTLSRFPFPDIVRESLGVDLTLLNADAEQRTWQTDQKSAWHDAFYRDFDSWYPMYAEFVHTHIASLIDEPFYFQRVPTFRVHQPGNLAVGEFHTDSIYNHPMGELNFWLPLTDAYDTCSVWIADDEGEIHAVNARPGSYIEFSAVTRSHGNKVNTTGHSRASFDFRCLPVRLLPRELGPPTKHTKLHFVPGEYYADEVVIPS